MELYTVQEAAQKLKTTTHVVYRLIKAKQIKALKLGWTKIPDYELDRFIQEIHGKDLTDLDNIKPFNEKELDELEEV